jgi:GNAT superfamily N-acetyltransferase
MIRSGQRKDVPEILALIQELALFENEPDAVKTTEADLLRDGFSESPFFQTKVCEVNGEIVGFALFFFCWSTWTGRPSLFLEDLYVKEKARGHGYGVALLQACAQVAVAKGCARFEWEVLDWNQGARDFYHKIGARHMEDWLVYRLDGEPLQKFAGQALPPPHS